MRAESRGGYVGNMERDGWGGGMESRPRMGRKDEGGGAPVGTTLPSLHSLSPHCSVV